MPEIDRTGRGNRRSGPGELRHRSEARPGEGVLFHGSRASGRHRDDSDYDLIRIVAQEAYDLRRDAGQLHERICLEAGLVGDVLFQTPSRIEAGVHIPGWFSATYRSAHVAFDRNGGIGSMLARMRSETDRIARDIVSTAYDAYLNGFVRSMKSARYGDRLGQRLHAAESALALVRAPFGLGATWHSMGCKDCKSMSLFAGAARVHVRS